MSALVDEVMGAKSFPNIVVVTLDCCRLNTAARAKTPTLD
jgi:hypothetical protein